MDILIVDDELQVAEVLAKSLAREGHSAQIANSGEEALRMLGTHEPDALFLDVSMPGMNGLDVLSQVKRLGAVDVIAKPAPLKHYQQALRRLDPPRA